MPALPGTGGSTVGCQGADLQVAAGGRNTAVGPGKKTAETIQKEVTREVNQLLRIIFQDRRKAGPLDLEAIEMAVSSAMHHAGSNSLTALLQFATHQVDSQH